MTFMKRTALALAAGATIALGGCGGGDDENNADQFEGDEQEVAQVVDRLGEAARGGDVKTICEELVTVELQRSVRQASGTSCGEEFTENVVSDETRFEVDDVTVQGQQATAKVTDQADRRSTIQFQRVEGDWRIARIQ
jgi:hypothetical protein